MRRTIVALIVGCLLGAGSFAGYQAITKGCWEYSTYAVWNRDDPAQGAISFATYTNLVNQAGWQVIDTTRIGNGTALFANLRRPKSCLR